MVLGINLVVTVIACLINIYYWELRANNIKKEKRELIVPYVPHSRRSKVEVVIMFVLMCAMAVSMSLRFPGNPIIFDLKRLLLLAVLFPMSLSDYRKHIIPNTALILGFVYWSILSIAELIVYKGDGLKYIVAELIVAVLLFIVMIFLKLIIRGGIGMGDVKLLTLMAMFQASNGLMSSITTSLIIILLTAIVLLVTKKKKRKDFIPFAPALLVGTYISVLVIGA